VAPNLIIFIQSLLTKSAAIRFPVGIIFFLSGSAFESFDHKIMKKSDSDLFVFREQSHLLGILADDFESHLPLNRVWLSHDNDNSPFWKYEDKQTSEKGYFIHPAMLFGFNNMSFCQSSIIFLNRHQDSMNVGILMNEFLMKIIHKKSGNKALAVELVKNFPSVLPKSAFHFVHRFKRKNILVLNPEGLMKEFGLTWPQAI
jgi:hypothetical protein